jgi:hypothetical protein
MSEENAVPMTRRAFVPSVAAAILQAGSAVAPVIVELFTSEGCSSCPPADMVVSELVAGDTNLGIPVLCLSEHVDYWNQLGWKDPFSQRLFSERQAWYAQFFRREGPYTPQMIVDGVTQFVGSDGARARAAIATAARKPKAHVDLHWGRTISGRLSRSDLVIEVTDVYLAITEHGLSTAVVKGENGGRQLRHDAVVRTWSRLGIWPPHQEFLVAQALQLQPQWNRSKLTAVLIAQQRNSRRIIAAASAAPGL